VEVVDALLDLFRHRGKLVDPGPIAGVSLDPGDDKFIACALAGRVDFLVTGNKRHFPPSLQSGVKVLNAAELLEFITLEM
jgi:predicted nucleic acid-binding protein